ncbi:MAG: guanylate kinase [Clostridiales bacterium]|jgi:guanylate kinase|nr:guanylate kinase [Clostridiales bacterium]
MGKKGKVFIVSGPSGVGKGTLCKNVVALCKNIPNLDVSLVVSVTEREPRVGEVDGVHYHFCSSKEFDDLIATNGLLEWATYNGKRYGTPRAEVESDCAAGKHTILEIEVVGANQILEKMPEAVSVFVVPPDRETLRKRLIQRGTETERQIEQRLAIAMQEFQQASRYAHVIVNRDLKSATDELLNIIKGGV